MSSLFLTEMSFNRMSVGADIGWTVVFSIMIINAIIGNIVVFWIVLCKIFQTKYSNNYREVSAA